MTEKLVKLEISRSDHERDSRFRQTNYESAAPFFQNPRGLLIHRPRSVYKLEATYRDEAWWIVDYWCGNTGSCHVVDESLLFDPGVELVCARCEAMAVAKGQKTSSSLAGRHICIGVCRPVNLCYPTENN